MKKKIIISEDKFHKLLKLMEYTTRNRYGRNSRDSQSSRIVNNGAYRNNLDMFKKLNDKNYFNNPNLQNNDVNGINKDAILDEMTDLVKMIYAVYESISHANSNYFTDDPTNEGPFIDDYNDISAYAKDSGAFVNRPTKMPDMSQKLNRYNPATFYASNPMSTYSTSNKRKFLVTTRCLYTLVSRLYADGAPIWANLFFNKDYRMAKMAYMNCILIARGSAGRLSAGIKDANNQYPEGTLNWIRMQKHINALKNNPDHQFVPLEHDIQPVTYKKKDAFADLMPSEITDKINQLNKFKRDNKNNHELEKYFVSPATMPTLNNNSNNNDDDDLNLDF